MRIVDLVISVVLYRHNITNFRATLDSLIALKGKIDLIVVFVDNGGTEWLEEYVSGHSHFFYIKSPQNKGFGSGHNLAIERFAAQSPYFLVCNPDVQFSVDDLLTLFTYANSSEGALFMPNIVYPNGQRQELCKLLPTPANLFVRRFIPLFANYLDEEYLLRKANFTQSFFVPSVSGCFMLFKTQALLEIGGFDERYFMYLEDVDLSRRMADKHGVTFVPQATITHDFQKASYKSYKMLFVHITSAIRYFNKWGWFFDKNRKVLNQKCLQNLPLSFNSKG